MKILVVDDDVRILKMLTKFLTKHRFVVDTAEDGKKAFERVKKKKYEVILVDIMMPEKNGFDLIRSVRAMGIHTPILVISARTMVDEKVLAINLGADDYLTKSFSLDELLARIKSLIRRNANTGTNVMHCGSLVINLADMTVTRQKKPVYLSQKELAILLALMKRKGNIVTREELVQEVWGQNLEHVSSNTLEVHIRFLRQKIDLPGQKRSLIKTFRGRGYMLKDKIVKQEQE